MTALRRETLVAGAARQGAGASWVLVLAGAVTLETADGRWTVPAGGALLVARHTAHRVTADVTTDLVRGDLRTVLPAAELPSPLVLPGFGSGNQGVVALVSSCQIQADHAPRRFAAAYANLLGEAVVAARSPARDVPGAAGAVTRAESSGGRAAGDPGASARGDASRGDGAVVADTPVADLQVARVVAALAADPGASWTLDRMAGLVHLSRSSLTDRFRRATGHSPMRVLREVRMHRARTLLTERCLAVTRVAFEVGYGSVAAFSRAFAADHGVAPHAWRTSGTAGPTPVGPGPAAPAPATRSVARDAQDGPAESRRHGRGGTDQQQRLDAVPVQ